MTKDQIIENLNINSFGQIEIMSKTFKELYLFYDKPEAKVIQIHKNIFISIKPYNKVSFKITDESNLDGFKYINKENSQIISVTQDGKNIFSFLLYELIQGKNFGQKFLRLALTLLPNILLMICLYKYASYETVKNVFTGLLTAVSVFVAIFTLFTVNHEYWERKSIDLFKSGKLVYYFSVDKNLAEIGVTSIILAIFGLLILNPNITSNIKEWNLQNGLIILILNLCMLFSYILLRSIIEFYIHRPAKFILGNMKKKFLENFEDDK